MLLLRDFLLDVFEGLEAGVADDLATIREDATGTSDHFVKPLDDIFF